MSARGHESYCLEDSNSTGLPNHSFAWESFSNIKIKHLEEAKQQRLLPVDLQFARRM